MELQLLLFLAGAITVALAIQPRGFPDATNQIQSCFDKAWNTGPYGQCYDLLQGMKCVMLVPVDGSTPEFKVKQGKMDSLVKSYRKAECTLGLDVVNCLDYNQPSCQGLPDITDCLTRLGPLNPIPQFVEDLKATYPHCHALRFQRMVNFTSDPCTSFTQFACGKLNHLYKTNSKKLKKEKPDRYTVLKSILSQKIQPSNPLYLRLMKNKFGDCMSIARLDVVTALSKDIWPTINQKWSSSTFDLQSVLLRYTKMFPKYGFWIFPLFVIREFGRFDDERTYGIGIVSGMWLDVPEARLIYMSLVKKLGGDLSVAERDFGDMEPFLTNFYKRSGYRNDLITKERTFSNFSATFKIPGFDWGSYLKELYNVSNPEEETIQYSDADYLNGLAEDLGSASPRVITNLLGFQVFYQTVKNYFEYQVAIYDENLRRRYCTLKVGNEFLLGSLRLIATHHLNTETRRDVSSIFSSAVEVFKGWIGTSPFQSAKAKQEALEKLDKMHKISFADGERNRVFDDEFLNDFHKSYDVSKDDFSAKQKTILAPFGGFFDDRVNPFSLKVNFLDDFTLNVPTRFTHFPIYQPEFSRSMKFGALGSHIAKATGVKLQNFDGAFEERKQCLLEQEPRILTFTRWDIKKRMEAFLTKSSAVRAAYRAFKFEQDNQEDTLPYLGLSKDQEFFVYAGMEQCIQYEHMGGAFERITFDMNQEQSIDMTFRNIPEFAEAFNCPAGSPMNPADRCCWWGDQHCKV